MTEKKSKREKFEYLAEKRVTDVIRRLRLIGNLANRNNYDYTADHVKQIMKSLESELRNLRRRFGSDDTDDGTVFTFK